MTVRLTLLGTGTPTPLRHRGGSSFLVRHLNHVLLFDCGPGTVRRLLECGVSPPEVDTLFLTHLHYDHCVDYGHLVLCRWDQGAGQVPDLSVYGPSPTATMTDRLFGSDGVFDPDLCARTEHPLSQCVYESRGGKLPRQRPRPSVTEVTGEAEVHGHGWHVRSLEVVHAQRFLCCLAYRLEIGGRTVVFTGDTAPIDAMVPFAQGADVLVHMCHFVNGIVTDPRMTGSCSGHLDAARTAQAAGVAALVLVHLSTQVEAPGMRERVLSDVGQAFNGRVFLGEDLLEIPLEDSSPPPLR